MKLFGIALAACVLGASGGQMSGAGRIGPQGPPGPPGPPGEVTQAAFDALAARVTALEGGITPVTPATRLFGTASSPHNRPISAWEADIKSHYSVSSVVDDDGTAELQACLDGTLTHDHDSNPGTPEVASCPNWSITGGNDAYVVFKQVSYAIYYAKPGDPEYPVANTSGANVLCPLDSGREWGVSGYTSIRVPEHVKVWNIASATPVTMNPARADTDVHFTIIDEERNRMYAFYSGSGENIGISGGKMVGAYRGCDLLHNASDALVLAPQVNRYSCEITSGSVGYNYGSSSPPSCGMAGIGAGISAGGTFGNTDSNGFLGGHGIIMPEDFDDTGWGCPNSEACGTLHHALRYSMPNNAQHGFMWPQQDPMAGRTGRKIRDGQIMRLLSTEQDPTNGYDIEANTGGASPTTAQLAQRRFLKTLARYGAVQSDYSSYGPAFFAVSDWAGTGKAADPNFSPWSSAGGANAEAVAFAQGQSGQGVKEGVIPANAYAYLQMILPHGSAYPTRTP